MALIKTCMRCGKRTDSRPYTQHGWKDIVCFECGGPGLRPREKPSFIPKGWTDLRKVNSPTIVPHRSQSLFELAKTSMH